MSRTCFWRSTSWRSTSLQFYSLRSVILSLAMMVAAFPVLIPRAAAQTSRVCASRLNDRIAAIVQRPAYQRMRWGILVQTQTGETLATQDAQRYFLPASTAKLFTTAAALQQFGPDFRIRTSVYLMPNPSNALSNQVVVQVVGRGDPSLTDAQLQQIARQIRDHGITQIDRLVGNDRFFEGDLFNPTWEWEDVQAGYGAPATSLILNQNQIDLELIPQAIGQPLRVEWSNPDEGRRWQIENRSRTVGRTEPESLRVGRDLHQRILRVQGQLREGSAAEPVAVSIPQPAQYFMEHLRQALVQAGVRVNQVAIESARLNQATQPAAVEIAAIESAPLASLIAVANQDSNNLYAETLLRWLGTTQPIPGDTLGAGIAALEATLTRLGVPPQSYSLADGSGLSRRNLVSPEALVRTLQLMAQSPHAAVYRNSLSIAGVSGTLRNRFRDTPIQGRLFAKTGSLTGVAALSGYFDPPNYPPLVLSLLVNQGGAAIDQVPQAIDEVLDLLVRLEPC